MSHQALNVRCLTRDIRRSIVFREPAYREIESQLLSPGESRFDAIFKERSSNSSKVVLEK